MPPSGALTPQQGAEDRCWPTRAAARDPRVFADPHTIDIERRIQTNNMFGYGPHRCIGSYLARLQALTTLEEMLRRMPDLRLAGGEAPYFTHSTVTRDLNALSLVFTPGEREATGPR